MALRLFSESPHSASTSFSALQPPEGRIQRALFHQQDVVALAANEICDGIAVKRPPDERLEDQDVQCAAKQIEPGFVHLSPLWFHRETIAASLGNARGMGNLVESIRVDNGRQHFVRPARAMSKRRFPRLLRSISRLSCGFSRKHRVAAASQPEQNARDCPACADNFRLWAQIPPEDCAGEHAGQ